jgi:DNA repair exonuclease SbcCD ATPase subunit
MFISYLRLDNFKGIYDGLGKLSVEIDFKNNKNKVIMLVGPNGSGKTTILSQLHPFMESQDERKNLILEGKRGYKEVHINDRGDIYKIKHHYEEGSNKSYIEKNGVDLNRNGGIKNFKSLVEENLGVTSDYFKIGRIGSNVSSFIDMKTSERKDYINKFLPDMDDYFFYFKNINKKYNKLKDEIDFVSDEISKIDKLENLEILKESLENQINLKNDQIKVSFGLIKENEGKMMQIDPDGTISIKVKESESLLKESVKDLSKINNIIEKKNEEYGLGKFNLEKTNAKLDKESKELINVENSIGNLVKELSNVKEEITKLSNTRKSKKLSLNELVQGESLEELQTLFDQKSNEIKKLGEYINSNHSKFKNYSSVSLRQLLLVKSSIENCISAMSSAKTGCTESLFKEIKILFENDLFNSEKVNGRVKSAKTGIGFLEDDIQKLKTHLTILESNLEQKEVLSKRPAACRIDGCEFIRTALRYRNIDNDISNKKAEISNKVTDLRKQKELLDVCENIKNIFTIINDAFQQVYKNKEIISKLPSSNYLLSFRQFCSLLEKSNAEIESILYIGDLIGYMESKEEYEIQKEKLKNIEEKLKILKQQKSFIDELQNEVNFLDGEIYDLKQREEEIDKELKELETKKEKIVLILSILEDFKKDLENKNKIELINQQNQEKFDKYKDFILTISQHEEVNKEENKKISYLEKEIVPVKSKLDETNMKIKKLEEYTLRKENLESNMGLMKIIHESLNPKKGIPLYFIDGYLKSTTLIANNLLDKAYSGKLRLEKFAIDESDFFIKIRKENGSIVKDVSLTSQGERALTTISICLSLIQQGKKRFKFDILCLDEIDAELDTNNRIHFINMLEEQIEVLGLEQVFIITHNNAFDAYPVDLILLKDNNIPIEEESYMKNKNIIFNWKES